MKPQCNRMLKYNLMPVFIVQVTKVGTVYLVQYIFENSTVNINALFNSCEDMACCSSVQCSVLYGGIALSLKPFGIGHMYIYNFFCLE
jgi:hypothetical protein